MNHFTYLLWRLSLLAWLIAIGISLVPSLRPPRAVLLGIAFVPIVLFGLLVIAGLTLGWGNGLQLGLLFALMFFWSLHPTAVILTGLVGGSFYSLKASREVVGLASVASACWFLSAVFMAYVCISMKSLIFDFKLH